MCVCVCVCVFVCVCVYYIFISKTHHTHLRKNIWDACLYMDRMNRSVNQYANVLASRKLSKEERKQKTPEPSPCRFRTAINVQWGTRPDIRMPQAWRPQAPPAIHVAYRHFCLRVIQVMRRSTAQACLLWLTAVKDSGRCVTEAHALRR